VACAGGIRTRIVYWALGLLALLVLVAGSAAATHYRYGTLSWEPTGNPNEVLFTGGQAWRSSFFGNPQVGDIIVGESGISTGDGGWEPIHLKVTSRSLVNDYFTAIFVRPDGTPGILHTYPAPNNNGAPWDARFDSCCRVSQLHAGNFHVNNYDQSESLQTRVDLSTGNSAPRSALPPINSCPREALCSIVIPRADAEDDPITFRLSTPQEAGDWWYHPPGAPEAPHTASIDATTGVLTWDTRGATVSNDPNVHTLYSIQIMLEDGKTQTPIDFFLEILPVGVTPPRWVAPPTPCGQTLEAHAGSAFSFSARAVSDDNRNVLMTNLGLPPGALMAMPSPSNPADATFHWTPALDQVGVHLVVLTAEDDRGYPAPACAVNIVVKLRPVAVAGPDRCVAFGTPLTFDGSHSFYPGGSIVSWRWDFPHGPSPLFGPVVSRTLNMPEDLAPYDVLLTVTANDSQVATDVVRVQAFDALGVSPSSSAPRYTPFQRPRGDVVVASPCGGGLAGTSVELVVRYTTNDAALDALLVETLGANALVWTTQAIVGDSGRMTWELPFTVAERYALPLGLLNPTSQLLVLDGDFLVEATATQGAVGGAGSTRFDVVLDHQFPLDGPGVP